MIEPRAFQNACSRRLMLLEQLQQHMETIRVYESELEKRLLAEAPKSVQQFLISEGTIADLLGGGSSGRKIVYDANPYRFKNRTQVTKVFQALVKAWRNSVTVSFSYEDHRVEVRLSVM